VLFDDGQSVVGLGMGVLVALARLEVLSDDVVEAVEAGVALGLLV
jgi:hypothetical protein